MATTYRISSQQTLMDACIQVYGTSTLLFSFAKLNGLSIDSEIAIGDELVYDESLGITRMIKALSLAGIDVSNEGFGLEAGGTGLVGMDGISILDASGDNIQPMNND